MKNSDLQKEVTDKILHREAEKINIGITDSELCTLVEVDGLDAAYTAEETRELAYAVDGAAKQSWGTEADDFVNYLLDLADVLDDLEEAEDIEEKWDGERQTSL